MDNHNDSDDDNLQNTQSEKSKKKDQRVETDTDEDPEDVIVDVTIPKQVKPKVRSDETSREVIYLKEPTLKHLAKENREITWTDKMSEDWEILKDNLKAAAQKNLRN